MGKKTRKKRGGQSSSKVAAVATNMAPLKVRQDPSVDTVDDIAKRIRTNYKTYEEAYKHAEKVKKYAPPYEPKRWNSDKNVRNPHNCFTYFTNKQKPEMTDKCKELDCEMRNILKPQPGYHSGCPRINDKKLYTCKKMVGRTLRDNPNITYAKNMTCPDGHYLGALAVHPGITYHYYRQDSNGYWSHKDGATDAVDIDASGKKIIDPEKANRSYPHRIIDGEPVNYKSFCGHFCIPKDQKLKWWQSGPGEGHIKATAAARKLEREARARGRGTTGGTRRHKKRGRRAAHPSNYDYDMTYASQMTPSEVKEVRRRHGGRKTRKKRGGVGSKIPTKGHSRSAIAQLLLPSLGRLQGKIDRRKRLLENIQHAAKNRGIIVTKKQISDDLLILPQNQRYHYSHLLNVYLRHAEQTKAKARISKNKRGGGVPGSKKQIVALCKKYGVTTSGSRKELANALAAMRSVYMTQKDKKMILPFLSNNVNKKIFVRDFKDKAKKMPRRRRKTRKT
jgi:hypothetical protein